MNFVVKISKQIKCSRWLYLALRADWLRLASLAVRAIIGVFSTLTLLAYSPAYGADPGGADDPDCFKIISRQSGKNRTATEALGEVSFDYSAQLIAAGIEIYQHQSEDFYFIVFPELDRPHRAVRLINEMIQASLLHSRGVQAELSKTLSDSSRLGVKVPGKHLALAEATALSLIDLLQEKIALNQNISEPLASRTIVKAITVQTDSFTDLDIKLFNKALNQEGYIDLGILALSLPAQKALNQKGKNDIILLSAWSLIELETSKTFFTDEDKKTIHNFLSYHGLSLIPIAKGDEVQNPMHFFDRHLKPNLLVLKNKGFDLNNIKRVSGYLRGRRGLLNTFKRLQITHFNQLSQGYNLDWIVENSPASLDTALIVEQLMKLNGYQFFAKAREQYGIQHISYLINISTAGIARLKINGINTIPEWLAKLGHFSPKNLPEMNLQKEKRLFKEFAQKGYQSPYLVATSSNSAPVPSLNQEEKQHQTDLRDFKYYISGQGFKLENYGLKTIEDFGEVSLDTIRYFMSKNPQSPAFAVFDRLMAKKGVRYRPSEEFLFGLSKTGIAMTTEQIALVKSKYIFTFKILIAKYNNHLNNLFQDHPVLLQALMAHKKQLREAFYQANNSDLIQTKKQLRAQIASLPELKKQKISISATIDIPQSIADYLTEKDVANFWQLRPVYSELLMKFTGTSQLTKFLDQLDELQISGLIRPKVAILTEAEEITHWVTDLMARKRWSKVEKLPLTLRQKIRQACYASHKDQCMQLPYQILNLDQNLLNLLSANSITTISSLIDFDLEVINKMPVVSEESFWKLTDSLEELGWTE